MKKEIASDIVVTLLNECEVDGETMGDVVERVGMEAQMLNQLVVNADNDDLMNAVANRDNDCPIYRKVFGNEKGPKIHIRNLAEKIINDVINNIDVEHVQDYSFKVLYREVELSSINLDLSSISEKIKNAIEEYLEELNVENVNS